MSVGRPGTPRLAAVALAAAALGGCAPQPAPPVKRADHGSPRTAGQTVRGTTAQAGSARTVRRSSAARPRRTASSACPDASIVGQKLMVSFRGTTTPPGALLHRIRRGQVGGVILFSENASPTTGSFTRLTRRLQAVARAGGQPPLLIATDQEGGAVRRVPGPPAASGAEMGAMSPAAILDLGESTGRSLRAMGIDVDLAPVVDVRGSADSFLGSRTFGTTTSRVARATAAFARGLQAAGVAATAKHYPGLGRTGAANTDTGVVRIPASRDMLDGDRRAFASPIAGGTRLVMISSAVYDAYDAARPAVLSRRIIGRLRRGGFRGVVISDDLATPALRATAVNVPAAATRAGVDILLYASSGGETAYDALRSEVCAHRVSHERLVAQVRRIIALKQALAHS